EIEQFLHILFGLPGETLESVEMTMKTLGKLNVYMGGWQGQSEALIMTGVRIYPHTELCKIAIEEGVITKDTNLLIPRFYITPAIDENKMFDLIRSYAGGQERWNVPGLDMNVPSEMMEFMQKQLVHYGI
ncbi:MAG: hypothetical protein JSV49_04635, partial [Thermoplasmata archaeon]